MQSRIFFVRKTKKFLPILYIEYKSYYHLCHFLRLLLSYSDILVFYNLIFPHTKTITLMKHIASKLTLVR